MTTGGEGATTDAPAEARSQDSLEIVHEPVPAPWGDYHVVVTEPLTPTEYQSLLDRGYTFGGIYWKSKMDNPHLHLKQRSEHKTTQTPSDSQTTFEIIHEPVQDPWGDYHVPITSPMTPADYRSILDRGYTFGGLYWRTPQMNKPHLHLKKVKS